MQKYIMVFSLALMLFFGVFGYPVLARQYDESEFAFITVLLFLNGFFGAFDFVRPVMVRHLAVCQGRINIYSYLIFSVKFSSILLFSFFGLFVVFLSSYLSYLDAIYISFSVFLFLLYSVYWAAFEIKGFVGWASLLRSFGFCFFVLSLIIFRYLNIFVSSAFLFMFSHVLVGVLFFIFSRNLVVLSKPKAGGVAAQHLLMTVPQNISRLIIDFSDRLFISFQGGGAFVAAYNAIYDVAAKSNIFSQFFVSYKYSELCRGNGLQGFVNFGLVISIISALLAILLIPVSEIIVRLYLGAQYLEFYRFVPVMFFLSSLYSLAFFSQGALRSRGLFDVLALHFSVCALIGVVSMAIFYYCFGLHGLLLSLFFLKSPGLLGYFYLGLKFDLGVFFRFCLCFYFFLLISFLIFLVFW